MSKYERPFEWNDDPGGTHVRNDLVDDNLTDQEFTFLHCIFICHAAMSNSHLIRRLLTWPASAKV